MTPQERERFVVRAIEIMNLPSHFMSESVPHNRAKRRAVDLLSKHFRAIGRIIYLGEELAVFYPGERPFTPDILAVRDVPEVEDDERGGWVVADEGRGIDLAFEILWSGDRKKDLVDNVERYARLGIHEYFIYNRKDHNLVGYRLPSPTARRYQRIIPQGGRHTSTVLGLDLALINNKLEFFYGMSEIFGSDDLIARLEAMMGSLEAKAAEAEERAADAEAKAADSAAKATLAITSLQDSILSIAAARGIAYSNAERHLIRTCEDIQVLQQWLVRIAVSDSMAEAMA